MASRQFFPLLFIGLALAAFAAQFTIDFTPDNVAASCLVLAASLAVLLYMLWTEALITHPLSTSILFGFCITSQLGALLAQSFTGVSLTENLRQPLQTFAWLALFQVTALLAHAIYRQFYRPQNTHAPSLLRQLLQRAGLYRAPNVGTLWFLGFIGLCGQLLGNISHGAVGKLAQAMAFVAWAPFLIPMYVAELGEGYCRRQRHYPFVIGYVLVIALLGIAANARGMMLSGLMTIALCTLLRAMRSPLPVRAAQVGKWLGILAVIGAMAIPMSDLMLAMSVARKARGNVSPMKMVEDTFYYVTQPQQLQAQRNREKSDSRLSSYDETYFDNPLLGRLMETKFHDNALYFANRLNEKDEERLWNITGDFFWATLPDPALKALRIEVDKDSLSFSMGDYLSHLGGAGELGGFKTGSGFGQGVAMFGMFFPLIYFCLCPILFLTVDVLAYRSTQGTVLVSALGMLGIWRMFQYGITGESLQYLFMAVVRGLPQNILLFLLLVTIARGCDAMLQSLLGGGKPARMHTAPALP